MKFIFSEPNPKPLDASGCLSAACPWPSADIGLHLETFINRAVLSTAVALSLWSAHYQSPLFGVNYCHIAEVGLPPSSSTD